MHLRWSDFPTDCRFPVRRGSAWSALLPSRQLHDRQRNHETMWMTDLLLVAPGPEPSLGLGNVSECSGL